MARLLLTWLINAAALFALPYLLDSVRVADFKTALFAALALGLINALIRPILMVLALPVTVLTLGLFIFVVNGLMFWLATNFVPGFQVAGFWSAVAASILFSIISWLLSSLLLEKK